AFDIKDVTFLTVLDNAGEAHCFNGSPEMFSGGIDIAAFVQSAMAEDAAGGFALVPDAGDGVLQGNDGADLLVGGAGDAVLDGGAGSDMLFGGAGDDTLRGGAGGDMLGGGAGSHVLFGGAGTDTLMGGEGGDVLDGGAGSDMLFGGAGDDTLMGGDGGDMLFGGGGCDLFVYDAGDVLVDGGTGFDFLMGADGKALEALLGASAEAGEGRSGIANIEAAIQTERSLTSMADLGMQVGEDGQSVELVSGWTSENPNAPMTLTATSDPDAVFVTYRHCDDSGTGEADAVMVAKVMLQTS
nr:hypothetical protein [Desulfovibrio sp.]